MTRKIPWIGTSWKMNKLRAEARGFAEALRQSPVAGAGGCRPFVIPPFPAIADVAEILHGTNVLVGAQNMHWADQGAWTGEVSPLMIKDCGAALVEIGHSERRTHFAETDATVALKVGAALRHGLLALVCVGDSQEDYEAGKTRQVLERQVRAFLEPHAALAPGRVIIAYEPVWSIGEGGCPASPDFANDQHGHLGRLVASLTGSSLPIIYGGSVNLDNCVDLATQENIDGLFIGRAAWQVSGFLAIANAVVAALQ